MIIVNTIDSTNFEVIVEGNPTTTHQVSVTHLYYEKLTDNRVTPEELIEASFKFLLERESNSSILPRFDLPIIERYFPEYEKTIKKYPKSDKMSSAMLKQGMAFLQLGDNTAGKILLRKVVKTYPNSNQAKIAKSKLARIK